MHVCVDQNGRRHQLSAIRIRMGTIELVQHKEQVKQVNSH